MSLAASIAMPFHTAPPPRFQRIAAPRVVAGLAWFGDRLPSPEAVARLRVERAHIADAAPVAIQFADEDFALIGNWRHRIVANLWVVDGLPVPDFFTGFGVERGDMAVDHADEDHPIVYGDATVAWETDLLPRIRPVLPFNLAGLCIECKDVVSSRGDVNRPIPNDRGGLHRIVARKLECPRDLHLIDVLRADLAFLDLAIGAVVVCRQIQFALSLSAFNRSSMEGPETVCASEPPPTARDRYAGQQHDLKSAHGGCTFYIFGAVSDMGRPH